MKDHSTTNSLAPLVLFVYNRPKHTERTLAAIAEMEWIGQTDLFIFSDGPKVDAKSSTLDEIQEVREIIRGFNASKTLELILSEENRGLANSIILGVGTVVEKYGRVIVLEDDLIPGKYFLDFMNNALDYYEKAPEVMQVSAHDYPVDNREFSYKPYFSPVTTTWGWGTWKRVWNKVDFDCPGFEILKSDKQLSQRFDVDNGYAYTKMLTQQMKNNSKISSWGIRFYWNVFRADGLVLYPGYPLVVNEGWDGSGTHGDSYELFPLDEWKDEYSPKLSSMLTSVNKTFYSALSKYLRDRISLKNKLIAKAKLFLHRVKNSNS